MTATILSPSTTRSATRPRTRPSEAVTVRPSRSLARMRPDGGGSVAGTIRSRDVGDDVLAQPLLKRRLGEQLPPDGEAHGAAGLDRMRPLGDDVPRDAHRVGVLRRVQPARQTGDPPAEPAAEA